MTGAALTNRNDDWPDRPSLSPSHGKTPVSPRPPIASPTGGNDGTMWAEPAGPLKPELCAGSGPRRRPRISRHARREPQEPDSCHGAWQRGPRYGLPGPECSGTRLAPRPQQTLSPASPAQAAWQRRGRAVAAKSDASDGAVPNRPSAAPARAVVLTSLIQLVGVAMNLRLRHRRSLRAIERNLADSDPSLTKLFSAFTVLAQGEERGRAEQIKARPLRALARRLAVNVRSHLH